MKANELMIGDWVSLFQGNPDGSNCNVQVSYIGEYGEVGINGCGEYTSANCHLLFPIHLTSEILEKNFTFDHYGFYFFGGDYHEVYIKECANGLWRVEADEIMSGLPTWKMFVSNLHELQHAMRLCGINKEIKL